MTGKKKQSAVVMVATVVGFTSVMSPVTAVYAADTEPAIVQQAEPTEIKETAPPITPPQELAGDTDGVLQDIILPEGWSWVDGNTIISKERTEYPVRFTVDDEIYDYSSIEGYDAEGQFVECLLAVAVNEQEPVSESVTQSNDEPDIEADKSVFSEPIAGEVEINDTNFPDENFRKYIIDNFDSNNDNKLSQDEINAVTEISVQDNNITSLKGIEYFTAITKLDCSQNYGLTKLDVSHNSGLQQLRCNYTGLTELDVSNNSTLTTLYCNSTNIMELNVSKNTGLKELNCSQNYDLTELDVSNNSILTNLSCDDTGITELNVSNNSILINLSCDDTGITELDVSKNTDLSILDCGNTDITKLDVSKSTKLRNLNCSDTDIISLELSNQTELWFLYYENCQNLVYVNLNEKTSLSDFKPTTETTISDILLSGSSFDLTDLDKNINVNKVRLISGGSNISGSIVSGVCVGTPLVYEYNCGKNNGTDVTMTVTVNFVEKSTITINSILNREYTGQPISLSKDDCTITGNDGAVTFIYEKQNDDHSWTTLDSAPINAGTYRVKAILAVNSGHSSVESDYQEFAITKAAPAYTLPTNLTAGYGQKLKDIKLPDGFTWEDEDQSVGNDIGAVIDATVKFTPENTDNYQEVPGIKVTVSVGVAIDEAHFPDNNFRKHYITSFDENKDNVLTQEEIEKVTKIKARYQEIFEITSIKGIEYFTNLEILDCSSHESLVDLDVSKNTALTYLQCRDTGITELDVSRNTALVSLSCAGTRIANLDVTNNVDLQILDCSLTDITNLDISSNTQLTSLKCNITKMTALDISKNTKLQSLECFETPLKNLDVKSNSELTTLDCHKTSITELDITQNTMLKELFCYQTDITEIDISQNPNLRKLDCSETKITSLDFDLTNWESLRYAECSHLVWVNIGDVTMLDDLFYPTTETTIPDVKLSGPSFDLTNLDKNIDVSKVTIQSGGGDISGTMVSGVSVDTPLVYEYDCGKVNGQDVKLTVTVHFIKGSSTIKANDLDLTYTGEPIELTKDNCSITGSQGKTTFEYSQFVDGRWQDMRTAPKDAGKYKVQVKLAEDDFFTEASAEKEFTIRQAKNSWTKDLSITGWTYKEYVESENKPTSASKFGTVTYTYSNDKDTGFTSTVPENAGIWYVKASVEETDNYAGLNAVSTFTITRATPDYVIPKGLAAVYGQTLKDIKLSDGFAWENVKESVGNAGKNTFKTVYTPDDTDNYIVVNDIDVSVTVEQAANDWTEDLSITGWTYGKYDENKNTPSASAKFGNVTFTYSAEKKGSFTENVPTEAGTWYVKAAVADTSNYEGLESEPVSFQIKKAVPAYTLPENLTAKYGQTLKDVTLPKDFAWKDDTQPVGNVGKNTFKAVYTPEDRNNYVVVNDITVSVSVGQAANGWIQDLSITGWTYNEYDSDKNAPSALAVYGTVTYIYSNKKDDGFTETVPTEAGTWYVKAVVAGTNDYAGLESEPVPFQIKKAVPAYTLPENLTATYGQTLKDIALPEGFAWENSAQPVGNTGRKTFKSVYTPGDTDNYIVVNNIDVSVAVEQAANSWTEELVITDWIYNEYDSDKNAPYASAMYGTVTYTYSDKKDGGFTETVPTEAGTWYVKAAVAETNDYAGLESDAIAFTITKAIAPIVIVPDNLSGVQDNKLSDIMLPNGWKWVNGNGIVTVTNNQHPARFSVDDKNYDYTGIEGYNAQGHYVERVLTMTVSAAANSWSINPSISGWTYGETAGTPTGAASHGTITYTYSNSENGVFTEEVPTYAGTWYMKASVEASAEYTGLNAFVKFVIEKAEPDYELPNGLKADYGQTLKEIFLPAGFRWKDDSQSVGNAGSNIFTAVYTPDDRMNYKEIEAAVIVLVSKNVNEWTEELTIPDISQNTDLDKLVIKDGDTELIAGKDYEIVKEQNGNTVTVTIKFKGSYNGTITKNYQVNGTGSPDGNTPGTNHTDGSKTASATDTPSTGDTTGIGIWASALVLAGGFMALLTGKKRKKDEGEE